MSEKNKIHHGNQFRTILKAAPWYFISTLLTKMASLFLMPIYTKYLSPLDYGILNTLISYGNALPLFISLSLDASFARYYFIEKKVSFENVKILYSTCFWFIVLWGGIFTCIALFLSPKILTSTIDIQFWPYIPLTIVPLLFTQLSLLGTKYIQANLKTKLYASIQLINFLLTTIIVLILLIKYNFGIKANLWGGFIGSIFLITTYTIYSIKNSLLIFHLDLSVLKRSLMFSLPLLPGLATSWITSLSDRLILAYYGRIAEVGLYSISFLIAQVVYFFSDAITQVQSPIGMSALTENINKAKEQLSEFLSVFIWGLIFIYLAITFFSKEILFIFANSRYHGAYKIVSIIAFIYVLGGVYRPFSIILSYHAKTWIIAAASIISATVNAVLNFAFIPHFGQLAAAWSTLFSIFAYTIWVIVWAQRIDRITVNWKLILCVLSTMGLMLTAQNYIEASSLKFSTKFIIKIIIISSYLFINVPGNINQKFRNQIFKLFKYMYKNLYQKQV